MAEQQSKFPDLNELTSMANKFYKTVKKGVCEIIDEYKAKREENTPTEQSSKGATSKPEKQTKETKSKPDEEK